MRSFTHLLAPVDLDAIPWEALDHVGKIASMSQALVDIVYVAPVCAENQREQEQDDACSRLLTLIAALTERYARPARCGGSATAAKTGPVFIGNLQAGNPVEVILDFATRRHHDVIVMGTSVGTHPEERDRESVSSAVLLRAHSRVVIIPDQRRPKVLYEASAHS